MHLANKDHGYLINNKIWESIELICKEYISDPNPWIIAFSGGKDSTAVLKLVATALSFIPSPKKPVSIVYCDTGVEIPVIDKYVHKTLQNIASEFINFGLPLSIELSVPQIEDRFFVKVIGRGFPTPTNKFRWCTDRLRINPVARTFSKIDGCNHTVLLGVRVDESEERSRTISRYRIKKGLRLAQSGRSSTEILAPILEYSIEDVWEAVLELPLPKSIDVERLFKLYKGATGECPFLQSQNSTPCGKGRFGCWTCTVVRKDHAVKNLIKDGFKSLKPLYDFRNWIALIRDDRNFRCSKRRNGKIGPGPFSLSGRSKIYNKLKSAENQANLKLLLPDEEEIIFKLWKMDSISNSYRLNTGDISSISL